MSKLDEIMTTPTIGLLPYLEDQLGADFNRLQARPHTFSAKGGSGTAGFRYREGRSEELSPHGPERVTQSIVIGKMIRLFTNDASGMREIEALEVLMRKTIREWFWCGGMGGMESLNNLSWTLQISPNTQEVNTWWVAVQIAFELTYIE